ncbi:MBL fold metallo-hydrolase [Enterococcus sp. LJL99]
MRIQHIKNLYQLAFLPNLFPINAYIYKEETSLTLIDIGLPLMCKSVIALADQLGKTINRILLTHAHKDHVSGVDELKKNYPNATVFISERDYALLNEDRTLRPEEVPSPIKGGLSKINTVPDQLLYGGEQIGSLKVLLTPGHTPGSISFLDKSGILIAGDSLQTKGGVAISGDTRLSFPFPALATWSKSEALNSIKKLPIEKITLLATGHGNMIQNPTTKIKKALSRMERKLINE